MSSQDDEPEYRVVALVLISVIVLAVGLALGIGIHKSRGSAPAAAAVVAAPAAAAVAASSDDASVVVENGVVKFYFASGKADLAAGALDALGEAIASAKAGKKLVVSGFHDSTGDAAVNAELAKQRAMTVQAVLVNLGVDAASVELKKPEAMLGGTDNAQARRVEVVVQ